MNRKLYTKLVFMIISSFILITTGTIVTTNFMRDARIFERPVVEAKEDTSSKKPSEDSSDDKVIKHEKDNKNVVASPKPKNANEREGGSSKGASAKEKISIEVLNCTDIKNLAEDIRATLEASGYSVSAGNVISNEPVKTRIIERSEKGAGAEIKNILKMGVVTQKLDPTSRFDVTVIIGDDYVP